MNTNDTTNKGDLENIGEVEQESSKESGQIDASDSNSTEENATSDTSKASEDVLGSEEMDDETTLNPQLMKEFDLEKSIKTFYNGLQMKRNDIKKIREMIKDALETDMGFATLTEKINEVKQEQRKIQDQLLQTSSIIDAKIDMKELNDEVKELQKLLSKNLLEYTKVSDKTSITMTDGETYEILENARLIKQK